MQVHEYTAVLTWAGSTAAGYRNYDRTHRVRMPPADTELVLSSDPAFLGDDTLYNPEQLLTAAVSSCQMLTFLALAALADIDVCSYRDTAIAKMPMRTTPRIETIVLRPVITVRMAVADSNRLDALVHQAHEQCFIARSLTADVVIEPQLRFVDTMTIA
jgi:organic hydroperoxide reductase OsmC/OhrA